MNIEIKDRRITWKRIYKRIQIPLMLSPVLFVVFGLFGGGILNAVISGFGYIPSIGLTEFTFDYYIMAFQHHDFFGALLFGLKISITSVLLSTAISLFIAVQLTNFFRGRGILKFIFRLPLQIPWLVVTFMVLTLLTDGGLLARLFFKFGWIESTGEFPHLLYTQNGFGIIFVYVWSQIGFVTLVMFSFLLGMDTSIDNAARTLGANRWQLFWRIQLPLMMPAVLMVSLLNFAFTFGDYATPAILGPTSPNTLPVVAYRLFSTPDITVRPQAMAMSVVIAIVSGIVLILYNSLMRRQQYTETKVRKEN